MATLDYIPPEKNLYFAPEEPPIKNSTLNQEWVLEIGPGKGELILDLAQKNPHINYVAVELKAFRFKKIARHIERLELKNLWIIRGDARECLTRLFPEGFFEKIYVLFPDPWPKKRHIKHRLLKPRLVGILHSLLKPEGQVISATDAGYYSEQIVESFEEVGGFKTKRISSPYPTYFEQKWKALGREINYWSFGKAS